VKKQTKKKEFN